MDLSGSYFEYNGTTSRKYGLIFAHVDTSEFIQLSGEVSSNVIYNKRDNRNYFMGESLEDSPIQFDAEIVIDGETPINRFERREIEKWLFHQPDYCKLYVDMDCDTYGESYELVDGVQKRLYLNCRFVNPEKIDGNGGLVGYKFEVECDSAMAWQDEIEKKYAIGNSSPTSSSVITVDVDTDLNDYIYPKVTISMGSSGGNIQIINQSDSPTRATAFTNVPANATIIMRGAGVNYISGDYYQKFSNKNFIRLLDGANDLIVTGNVDNITFEFQNRRYL